MIRKEQDQNHLAFIARDLRTPLNAISLLVEELHQGLPPETVAENADTFSVLRRNLQRLEVEIDVSGSSFRPERRVFELWPLVQRLIVDLAAISARTATQIVSEIPRSLTVFADAGLISQVFQNLLGNAFKYAATGQVRISAREENGVVHCKVRDNGAGIPLAMLERVFDKLVTDPEKQGTGLGLAIVKQIVEAHGGEVSAQSVHGAGATFTFTLPAEEQAPDDSKHEVRKP